MIRHSILTTHHDSWSLRSITGYNKRNDATVLDGDYFESAFQVVNFTPGGFPISGFPTPPFGFGFVPGLTDFTFSNKNRTEDFSQEIRLEFDGGENLRGNFPLHDAVSQGKAPSTWPLHPTNIGRYPLLLFAGAACAPRPSVSPW